MANTQHTAEFIDEMKNRLLEEREQLNQSLKSLAHKDNGDYQADFPEYGRHQEENATEIGDYQAATSTTETLESRLKEVEAALLKIEKGEYGMTDNGEKIPEERLRANPAATTLVKKGE